ncbi:uncharacterized protein [Dermacentor albipictus]|uniref:uncharacterized protein n=1 Tax=Dermacentor albipictus TaxID=60249 RepID=UPI0038FC3D9E
MNKRFSWLNVYSNPSQRKQRFKTLLRTASTAAGRNTLIACGDFNAMNPARGYKYTAKGRDLYQDATELDFTLITDPTNLTRIGNSVLRETTPDLTFVKNDIRGAITWRNTGTDLGSDHTIVEIGIPEHNDTSIKTHRRIEWDAFRDTRSQKNDDDDEIEDIDSWTAKITKSVRDATKEIETGAEIDKVDSRLAHLIEAKQSILHRWKKQRLNRRLRKKVAELNSDRGSLPRSLHATVERDLTAADGQMHSGETWHLLDETKTKSHQRDRLARLIHRAVSAHGVDEVTRRTNDKYLPSTPTEQHAPYSGLPNAKLDRDIDVEEALKNLDDGSIENLAKYYKCWRAGALPKLWKAAKTILIPKPGKPPHTDNLRPISLTSCVGKVHVLLNKWQGYLEREGLYPATLIGFRQHLSTLCCSSNTKSSRIAAAPATTKQS